MCPETPQWWQTWGLTKDLELARSVLDFIPLLPFSDYSTRTVLNPEAVEEKGSEETAYLKLVLSELDFWALKTSSSFALDILLIWVLAWLSSTSRFLPFSSNKVFSTTRVSTNLVVSLSLTNRSAFSIFTVGKSGFVSHTKHTVKATNMDLFHSWLITCTM